MTDGTSCGFVDLSGSRDLTDQDGCERMDSKSCAVEEEEYSRCLGRWMRPSSRESWGGLGRRQAIAGGGLGGGFVRGVR